MSNIAKGGFKKNLKVNYYQKRRGKKIKLICQQCGKEVEKLYYEVKKRNAKFCSIKCSAESRKIEMPSRKALYDRYWKNEISVNQLAKEYSVSKYLIYKWMKIMQISTRTISKGVSISQIGIKHSKEWNEAISRGQNNMKPELKKKRALTILRCNRDYGNKSKGGTRKDLGIYVRSCWEANMCRYYSFISIKWEYESKTFFFNDSPFIKKKIKKGTLSYTPDFYLSEQDIFTEIKGWFRPKDKTKLRRFKRYYPKKFDKLIFVIYDKYSRSKANGESIKFLCGVLGVDFKEILNYKDMEKYRALIPGWE